MQLCSETMFCIGWVFLICGGSLPEEQAVWQGHAACAQEARLWGSSQRVCQSRILTLFTFSVSLVSKLLRWDGFLSFSLHSGNFCVVYSDFFQWKQLCSWPSFLPDELTLFLSQNLCWKVGFIWCSCSHSSLLRLFAWCISSVCVTVYKHSPLSTVHVSASNCVSFVSASCIADALGLWWPLLSRLLLGYLIVQSNIL